MPLYILCIQCILSSESKNSPLAKYFFGRAGRPAAAARVVRAAAARSQTLAAGGMNADQTRQALDNLTQSQSVMLATNEIMAFVSLAFFLSALLIWAAPKPKRAVQLGAAH